jgi:hypothetical protein
MLLSQCHQENEFTEMPAVAHARIAPDYRQFAAECNSRANSLQAAP